MLSKTMVQNTVKNIEGSSAIGPHAWSRDYIDFFTFPVENHFDWRKLGDSNDCGDPSGCYFQIWRPTYYIYMSEWVLRFSRNVKMLYVINTYYLDHSLWMHTLGMVYIVDLFTILAPDVLSKTRSRVFNSHTHKNSVLFSASRKQCRFEMLTQNQFPRLYKSIRVDPMCAHSTAADESPEMMNWARRGLRYYNDEVRDWGCSQIRKKNPDLEKTPWKAVFIADCRASWPGLLPTLAHGLLAWHVFI